MPASLSLDAFPSFTLAIALLFAGKALTQRFEPLRRYAIPEAVTGGMLCAAVVAAVYLASGLRIEFDLEVRSTLMLYFFAGIGLKSDVRTLREGGRPLLILAVIAGAFIVLQNLLGMAVAGGFGLDPRAGLMTGSIALTGGVGTTLAWADDFTQRLGIVNALELGLASNMVGLLAACVVGGPIAGHLIRRYRIPPSGDSRLDIGVPRDDAHVQLDYYGVLRAWLWLNLALMLGHVVSLGAARIGLNLPAFVGCLVAGMLIRNIVPGLPGPRWFGSWAGIKHGVALISDICLGMFLTMALMGLQIWALTGALGFVLTALVLQIALAVAYARWVVFFAMGRDYQAVVVAAGFGGIALGSTATAVANMTAVTQQYGAAHRAFIVVPLVCGFFVDLINALVISVMAR
ncbi:MAG: sodium/glutamate symporter [Burkholderiaceae bacterium]